MRTAGRPRPLSPAERLRVHAARPRGAAGALPPEEARPSASCANGSCLERHWEALGEPGTSAALGFREHPAGKGRSPALLPCRHRRCQRPCPPRGTVGRRAACRGHPRGRFGDATAGVKQTRSASNSPLPNSRRRRGEAAWSRRDRSCKRQLQCAGAGRQRARELVGPAAPRPAAPAGAPRSLPAASVGRSVRSEVAGLRLPPLPLLRLPLLRPSSFVRSSLFSSPPRQRLRARASARTRGQEAFCSHLGLLLRLRVASSLTPKAPESLVSLPLPRPALCRRLVLPAALLRRRPRFASPPAQDPSLRPPPGIPCGDPRWTSDTAREEPERRPGMLL